MDEELARILESLEGYEEYNFNSEEELIEYVEENLVDETEQYLDQLDEKFVCPECENEDLRYIPVSGDLYEEKGTNLEMIRHDTTKDAKFSDDHEEKRTTELLIYCPEHDGTWLRYEESEFIDD